MKKPETRFSEKVASRFETLKRSKARLWYLKTQMVARLGIPDYLICANGIFVAWELKVGDNKTSDLQGYVLQLIEKAGGISRVVYPENFEEAFEEVECLCGKRS